MADIASSIWFRSFHILVIAQALFSLVSQYSNAQYFISPNYYT